MKTLSTRTTKSIIATMSVGTILCITSATAFADQEKVITYVAADNSYASELCVTVATGNKFQLAEKVKALKPTTIVKRNYEYIANRVSCNGTDVTTFAVNAGNYDIAEQLVKHREGSVKINDIAKVETPLQGNVKIIGL